MLLSFGLWNYNLLDMHNMKRRLFLEMLARSANSGTSTAAFYFFSFCGS